MNPVVRNILAVIAGIVGGSLVNMSIIMISGSVIPPPEGSDVTTTEGLTVAMPLFQPKHFIMPLLAHSLGTFVGAFLVALIAASYKTKLAIIIGLFFLAGGIYTVFMLPSPVWFSIVDLTLAYLPMAYLGGKLGMKGNR